MKKVVLVGMCPGYASPGRELPEPLMGSVGRRLARLAGLSYEGYLARFDRRNLLPRAANPWPRDEARIAAAELATKLAGRDVVLLGGQVWDAFFHWSPSLATVPWFFSVGAIAKGTVRMSRFYKFPHPSGKSRYWNDPDDTRRASEFLKSLASEKDSVR